MIADFWPYIVIVLLLLCSAFFSGSEIAYASANKLRLKKAAEKGSRRAKWAKTISDHYDRALCTILMGNNMVNIAASSLATTIALSLVGELGAAYAALIMTVIILIFGEIVPKQLAQQKADKVVILVSPLLRFLMILTRPLVFIVMRIVDLVSRLWGGKSKAAPLTDDELVTIIETVEEEGVIGEERSDLLQSAVEFAEIEAGEIITHRTDLTALDIDAGLEEILRICLSAPFSRFPVYKDGIDNIIGVLHLNHLLKALIDDREPSIRALLSEAWFIPRSKKVQSVLTEMQRRQLQMAVVIDDFGGTLGILTMEDILEQIVGDIWDETDTIRHEWKKLGENRFEIDGTMGIHDFLDLFDLSENDFEDGYVTSGGWAMDMLETIPRRGDHFDYGDLTITVAAMDELRIKKLLVEKNRPRKNQKRNSGL
jgi:CBS domain containing-hemolysin-like protein